MRIYTKAGDLAFSTFTFPDGQPHFKLETYEVEFRSVTVETAIRNPAELFQACLVSQVLRQHGYSEVNLDIRYLMGARMDRAISTDQPFTLELVARLINGAGFTRVRILDVHSEAATRLIRNSTNLLPHAAFGQARNCSPDVFVVPDKGAVGRCSKLFGFSDYLQIVQCGKRRNPQTGELAGFEILDGLSYIERGRTTCLIVDDICDGGGTFVGLSKELRKAGAKKVYLYVTHGVFSRGLPLEGIDKVYTTDSYTNPYTSSLITNLVVIPISMKDIP